MKRGSSGAPFLFASVLKPDVAARCYELTGLGYLGADVVLDADRGPLLLELNARPGLNAQIANQEGVLKRLAALDDLARLLCKPEDRVQESRLLAERRLKARDAEAA